MGKENFESHDIKNRESGKVKKFTVIAKMDSGDEHTFAIEADNIYGVMDFIVENDFLINHLTPKTCNVARSAKIETFRIVEE